MALRNKPNMNDFLKIHIEVNEDLLFVTGPAGRASVRISEC